MVVRIAPGYQRFWRIYGHFPSCGNFYVRVIKRMNANSIIYTKFPVAIKAPNPCWCAANLSPSLATLFRHCLVLLCTKIIYIDKGWIPPTIYIHRSRQMGWNWWIDSCLGGCKTVLLSNTNIYISLRLLAKVCLIKFLCFISYFLLCPLVVYVFKLLFLKLIILTSRANTKTIYGITLWDIKLIKCRVSLRFLFLSFFSNFSCSSILKMSFRNLY